MMPDSRIDRDSKQGRAIVLRGDARNLPLPESSVDLICVSPPYWAQRSYKDGGEHYAGQIGDEDSPAAYIDNLLECVAEWVRVLKPTGSLFVNLNDKYASNPRGPDGSSSRLTNGAQQRPGRIRASSAAAGVPRKSLLLLPERFRIACVDKLGLIARETIIWNKANPMPESATDRCRRSHEDWVHFTKAEHYYSAIDLLRKPHADTSAHAMRRRERTDRRLDAINGGRTSTGNPLGSLPASVWTVATQPLTIPPEVAHGACCAGTPVEGCDQGLVHHAAFPSAWPRKLITGWCPADICGVCGEGRRPVVVRGERRAAGHGQADLTGVAAAAGRLRAAGGRISGGTHRSSLRTVTDRSVIGDACACPDASASVRPAVVLDPMGGTGTTALVAKALGRFGITIDRSADYCRLATWRVNDPKQLAKAAGRAAPPKPRAKSPGQLDLFGGAA